MDFQYTLNVIEKGFQLAGVVVLVLGALMALLWSGTTLIRHQGASQAYQKLREGVGRAILVGLELLVAADIIRSVAIDPTFQSVGVLALIVLVRTFLSWSLEVEITGAWPWHSSPARPSAGAGTADQPARPPRL